MATRPNVRSALVKKQGDIDGILSSSSPKFDFSGVLNIQPVDEANTEYLTIQMKVNGITKEVQVPVPFLNERHPSDVPKSASAQTPSAPEGSIIRNLLTELEEEVSHHVRTSSSSSDKVTRDVNENQILAEDSILAKSESASVGSNISLDNVIVIAPDDDDDDDDLGGSCGRQHVDKTAVKRPPRNSDIKCLPKVTPKVTLPLTTAPCPAGQKVTITTTTGSRVTPVTVLPEATCKTGMQTQNTGQVILLRGAGLKEQFMVMSKQSGDVYLTPVTGNPSPTVMKPPVKTTSSTTVIKLVGNQAGIVGRDGNVYIPVGSKPPHSSILKTVFPISKTSTSSSELNRGLKIDGSLSKKISIKASSLASNVVKTLDHLKGSRSILKLSANTTALSSNTDLQDTLWSSSPNSGSVDDLRISSVCSLVSNQKEDEKNGSSTSCTPGKGLLSAIMNDLQKPFLASNSTNSDTGDASLEGYANPAESQTTSFSGKCGDDKAGQESFVRKRAEIKPEWLKGFKEDPELRVVVEKLDLGPRFKSCHVDRLQQHLAYRRRQRRAELLRKASDHVYSAKLPQNVKKEDAKDQSSLKEELTASAKIEKVGQMIMIKTSVGSYVFPMVPGLTISGLVESLNAGLVKLPPIKAHCLVSDNKRLSSACVSSRGVLTSSGKSNASVIVPNITPAACSPALLTLKTEPSEVAQSTSVQMQHSGLIAAGSRVTITSLPPATPSVDIHRKPVLYNLISTSKCSSGNSPSLLKRSASSDSGLIKEKKFKRDLDADHSSESKDDNDSSSKPFRSSKLREELAKGDEELSHVNRIKELKKMLKEQEAAIEKMRKQRRKITDILKEID